MYLCLTQILITHTNSVAERVNSVGAGDGPGKTHLQNKTVKPCSRLSTARG